jgi:hypothetical protein
LPERRKTAKIRTGSAVHMGNPGSIEWRGRNAPIVTHHWYTPEGKLKA